MQTSSHSHAGANIIRLKKFRTNAFGTILLSIGVVAYGQQCTPQDADCDGIPDSIEAKLLEQYRPYLKFSRDNGDNETFRPADVVQYLNLSEVDGSGKEGDKVIVQRGKLQGNTDLLISLNAQGAHSTLMQTRARSNFYVNPDNDQGRRGVPWLVARASRRTGLYGHVVPFYAKSAEEYTLQHVPASSDNDGKNQLFYKIEYWQFFGYSSNNKPFDEGDHEGDWDTVQLIVQPTLDPSFKSPCGALSSVLKSVLHYAHGRELRFDLSSTSSCAQTENSTVLQISGPNVGKPEVDLRDDDFWAKAHNRMVSLYKDPVTGAYTHPVVYVEHGGHEFWPSPDGKMYGAQKHRGDDTEDTYLAATPPNLGEVEHPLNSDPAAAVILQFNGYWGTYSRSLPGFFSNNPPPGPPLHYEWTYPMTSSIRWQLQGLDY